jgi:hypothetical protein
MHYPLEHCQYDDPDVCHVCQEKNGNGVYYKAIPGAKTCPRHGGNTQIQALAKKAVNQYRIEVWQNRIGEFTESDGVKSLRAEIGILRLMLETTLNQCNDSTKLMLYSNKISDLATRIEKLVMSCDKLEKNMGMMLDKSTALRLASDIVSLIAQHVDNPEVIDNISNGIIDLLKEL